MKMKIILIFLLINFEFSFVPIWNFDSSTYEVFPSTESSKDYILYNFNGYKLVKRLTRDSNGQIVSKNILTINGGSEIIVEFENLDSVYYNKIGQTNLVCPRGKYHPVNPTNGCQVIPLDFVEEGDWDLHCFEHRDPYYFYIAYFSNGQNSFYGNRNNGGPLEHHYVRNEWYACKLQDYNLGNNHYPLMLLASDGGRLKLIGSEFTISHDSPMNRADISLVDIGLNIKSNTSAYFSDADDTFYYVTYDSNSMISGYSTTTTIDNYAYVQINGQNVVNLVKNEESPLNFFDDVTIEHMDFIPGTNYLYYTLNSDSGKYYGIIDIIANQVIFNTDKEITSMIPTDTKRLLIITPTSAFIICLFKDSNNNCLNSCSSNKIISTEGNTCGVSSSSLCNLKLQPENLCITSCDSEIYIEIDGVCATCSYFKNLGQVSGEYKFINSSKCIENRPNNSMYYNEKNKLLYCPEGYKLDESTQTCITNCYELCTICDYFSNDPLNQQCKGCIFGYYLNDDNNCIKNIPTTIQTTITTTIPTTIVTTMMTTIPITTTPTIDETNWISSSEVVSCSGSERILLPDKICIPKEQCNTTIYNMNSTYCGLCKDMESPKSYRFIGGSKCLNEAILSKEGVILYKENLYLLMCDKGYILENDICVPNCYRTCLRCDDHSAAINNQKCKTCIDGYYLTSDKNCEPISMIDGTIKNNITTGIPITNGASVDYNDKTTTTSITSMKSTDVSASGSTNINFNKSDETYDIVKVNDKSQKIIEKTYQILSNDTSILSNNIFEDNLLNNSDNNLTINSSNLPNNTKVYSSEYPYNNITFFNNEEKYQEIINDILQEYNISEGKEVLINGENNFIYLLTTSETEKNILAGNTNIDNKISKIDLGYCENILKEYYHIDYNLSLIILKFEKVSNISKERTLQYEVYEPFNKTKLNLTICDNTSISIYSHVVLSDELKQIY